MASHETEPNNLAEAAVRVIDTTDPDGKVAFTLEFAERWRVRRISTIGHCAPPNRPGRPERPALRPPGKMPRRRKSGAAGRTAFVHAIAHIELNAIDLAWDIVARFTAERLPDSFYDDWVSVARDEAIHFDMLRRRLRTLGSDYGNLPAHDGLWEAAERTADDLLARLALVPMVLEARGLDTTPRAVDDLKAAGDPETAAILERIGNEEVPHIAAGVRWFEYLCAHRGLDPIPTFHGLVRERFAGTIKPPFNHHQRDAAGLDIGYYERLAPVATSSPIVIAKRHAKEQSPATGRSNGQKT